MYNNLLQFRVLKMGYDTEFSGYFVIDTPLTQNQIHYIQKFSETRRMKRIESKIGELEDPLREAVNLPIGEDGEYYVGSKEYSLCAGDSCIVNNNYPPSSQPGLWCNWTVSNDGLRLEWNGTEKFYSYIDWIHYMINHFFTPWQKTLKGVITWQGEYPDDHGKITIKDSVVTISYANELISNDIDNSRKKILKLFA